MHNGIDITLQPASAAKAQLDNHFLPNFSFATWQDEETRLHHRAQELIGTAVAATKDIARLKMPGVHCLRAA